MSSELTVGFIGAGKMATALAKAFVQAGLVKAENLRASDPVAEARAHFSKVTGGKAAESNADLPGSAEVLILAVKPAQTAEVLGGIRSSWSEKHLLLSIAAGVTLSRLEGQLTSGARVIRVMPNTPALVGASATAFAVGQAARAEDGALAQKLFSAVGMTYQLPESLMDAVTGLSGSGPAYVFLMIEALSDGGVAAGLPRDIATRLAAQTVLGSARMVLESGIHTGALKDMVASPGGTTIEGIHQLERAGVRGAFIEAVRAATEKSRELGRA